MKTIQNKEESKKSIIEIILLILGLIAGLIILISIAIVPPKVLSSLTDPWEKVFYAGMLLAIIKSLIEYVMWILSKLKKQGVIN